MSAVRPRHLLGAVERVDRTLLGLRLRASAGGGTVRTDPGFGVRGGAGGATSASALASASRAASSSPIRRSASSGGGAAATLATRRARSRWASWALRPLTSASFACATFSHSPFAFASSSVRARFASSAACFLPSSRALPISLAISSWVKVAGVDGDWRGDDRRDLRGRRAADPPCLAAAAAVGLGRPEREPGQKRGYVNRVHRTPPVGLAPIDGSGRAYGLRGVPRLTARVGLVARIDALRWGWLGARKKPPDWRTAGARGAVSSAQSGGSKRGSCSVTGYNLAHERKPPRW